VVTRGKLVQSTLRHIHHFRHIWKLLHDPSMRHQRRGGPIAINRQNSFFRRIWRDRSAAAATQAARPSQIRIAKKRRRHTSKLVIPQVHPRLAVWSRIWIAFPDQRWRPALCVDCHRSRLFRRGHDQEFQMACTRHLSAPASARVRIRWLTCSAAETKP
jgi:hypothetical protein